MAETIGGEGEGDGRNREVAVSLMQMALALLDRAAEPLAAARLQHALDALGPVPCVPHAPEVDERTRGIVVSRSDDR